VVQRTTDSSCNGEVPSECQYLSHVLETKTFNQYAMIAMFIFSVRSNMYEDEVCDSGFANDVEQMEDGSYKLTLEIPSAYFRFVIGKKGETKRRIENETRTLIRIPRQGMEGDIG
jgi:hypothetical protein